MNSNVVLHLLVFIKNTRENKGNELDCLDFMNHLLNKYLVRQNELFQNVVPIEMLPRTFFQELISRPTLSRSSKRNAAPTTVINTPANEK